MTPNEDLAAQIKPAVVYGEPVALRSCVLVGNETCIERDPTIAVLHDHIYNPSGARGCVPGIYDFGRKLVPQSFYSRGPNPKDVFPGIESGFAYNDITEYADDKEYVYLGQIHSHFGHFLLSTVSRLWEIRQHRKQKILCFANPNIAAEINKGYVQRFLAALDIDPSRLVTFDRPKRIKTLTLPYPSFEERNYAHRAFQRMCHRIGDRLVSGLPRHRGTRRPIFLSKARLKTGVRKILNEDVICEHLERAGVEIAYPETLSLPDQIALWRRADPIIAFTSSALHSSIFSPGARFVSFAFDGYLDTSFTLLDWANSAPSSFYYFDRCFEELGPSDDFNPAGRGLSSRLVAQDPAGIATAMLGAIEEHRSVRL